MVNEVLADFTGDQAFSLDIIAYAYDYKARHLKKSLKKENSGSPRSQLERWKVGILE